MTLLETLQMLSYIATLVGIPVGLFVYIEEKRKERKDREYGTYNALDEKYKEFLVLCMDNPDLDLYDVPIKNAKKLTEDQKVQQLALFDILVSLLERAFLMYRDQSNRVKQKQWKGWVVYMDDYAAHPTFRKLWKERGMEYDEDFMVYMGRIVAPHAKKQ